MYRSPTLAKNKKVKCRNKLCTFFLSVSNQNKENDLLKLLFPSLTLQTLQEWLGLFRNPQRSSGCRQLAACLFFMLLLGLNTRRLVPTFSPALVWLYLTFCEIRTRFNSWSSKRQLGERTPVEKAAEKHLKVGDDYEVCSASANVPLLCYLSSVLSQERGRAILVCFS